MTWPMAISTSLDQSAAGWTSEGPGTLLPQERWVCSSHWLTPPRYLRAFLPHFMQVSAQVYSLSSHLDPALSLLKALRNYISMYILVVSSTKIQVWWRKETWFYSLMHLQHLEQCLGHSGYFTCWINKRMRFYLSLDSGEGSTLKQW